MPSRAASCAQQQHHPRRRSCPCPGVRRQRQRHRHGGEECAANGPVPADADVLPEEHLPVVRQPVQHLGGTRRQKTGAVVVQDPVDDVEHVARALGVVGGGVGALAAARDSPARAGGGLEVLAVGGDASLQRAATHVQSTFGAPGQPVL
ncbi:hypothetical protein ONE63_009941 [Megalurothrips usitatus]|uniref:Uncharacterized protein n=1 Tax=Megalurothrips usitatus TaxID=439358 RepID=A0AAV7XKZ2_9NEOP|nr:hypothetical protein ONE63_009941 [Megalurothrips usitatus]